MKDQEIENQQHELNKTPLHSRHVALGAHMSPFGGWDMPIHYSSLEEEHEAVRTACGLFDVSHMGEVVITGPGAKEFVNEIFTNDVSEMDEGEILYGMMLNRQGGVEDDLLVYKGPGTDYLLVINASNAEKDLNLIISEAAGRDVVVTDMCSSIAQLAIQGPQAAEVLRDVLGVDGSDLDFYHFKVIPFEGGTLNVSRTGYTGEDGFELYSIPAIITLIWDRLMESGRVKPCGLGCRDTLRFEAGLPLYGNELDDATTPLEAGLGMFVKLDKPSFIGREKLAEQKAQGVTRKLVGLELKGPGIARHGYPVVNAEGRQIGHITTGYLSPTLGRTLAMAYVEQPYAALGSEVAVQIRRRQVPAVVVKRRFYTPRYKK